MHDSPLGLGRLELGLVEHDHLEQDGVGRRWAWWGTHGYSCGVLGKSKNERLRTPSSVLVHFPSTPSPPCKGGRYTICLYSIVDASQIDTI